MSEQFPKEPKDGDTYMASSDGVQKMYVYVGEKWTSIEEIWSQLDNFVLSADAALRYARTLRAALGGMIGKGNG